MAARKKRRVDEEMKMLESNSDGDQSDCGEMDDESQNVVQEMMHIQFVGETAEEYDFHGIQVLLKQLFLRAPLNAGELADTIISQNEVGCVFKQERVDGVEYDDDEEDALEAVYGLITVVNITQRRTLSCVKELHTWVLGKCPSAEKRDRLRSLLNDDSHPVGLLINERFVNLQAVLCVRALVALWEDLTPTPKNDKKRYQFDYYILVGRTFFEPKPEAGKKSKKHKPQEVRKFHYDEHEQFYQESVLSFDFSVKEERDTAIAAGDWEGDPVQLEPFLTVMVIPASKIPVIMGRLLELYPIPPQ